MDSLSNFMPLFTSIIAFCAFFTFFGLILHWFLVPIKENQKKMEEAIKQIQKRLTELEMTLTLLKHIPQKRKIKND